MRIVRANRQNRQAYINQSAIAGTDQGQATEYGKCTPEIFFRKRPRTPGKGCGIVRSGRDMGVSYCLSKM